MSPNKEVTIRTRRGLVAVVIVATALLPAGSFLLATRLNQTTGDTEDNCMRIHRIVVAGERILDTKTSLKTALDRGLITREAYDAALAQSEPFRALRAENLRIWRSADCRPNS